MISLFLVGIFSLVGIVSAITNINSCQALSSNTKYNLTSNVTGAEDSHCFTDSGDNITLECNGYTIFGNGSAYGVIMDRDEIFIHNCFFENWTATFAGFITGANGRFENITVKSDSDSFRGYTGGDNNTFNNFVTEGTAYLYLYGNSKDNIINNLTGGLKIATGVNNTIVNNWTLTGITFTSEIKGLNTTINRLNRHDSSINLDIEGDKIFINNAILEDNSNTMRVKSGTFNIEFDNLTLKNSTFSADSVPNLTMINSNIYNSTSFIFVRSVGTDNFTNFVFENNTIENSDISLGVIENGRIKNNSFSNLYLIFTYANSYNVNISFNNFSNASINSDTNPNKNGFKIFNNTFSNSAALSHSGVYINYLNDFEIYNNIMLNNDRGITLQYASNGIIYDNDIRHGGHGILLNLETYNVSVYDNYVENESFAYLFEYGAYNNTMYNNNMSGGIFYSLHDTHDNVAYDNYIDGDLILHDNVTNELFYNNVVTGDLIFRADYALGNGTGAFNNTIRDTPVQGNLEVKENSTDNILLNVTWEGTETVDANNLSSYIRKWYLTLGSTQESVTIIAKNSSGNTIYTNTTSSGNLVFSKESFIGYTNNGGTVTNETMTITASKSGYDTQSQSLILTNNTQLNFTLSETVTEDTAPSGGGSPTYNPTESDMQEGYTKQLAKSWKLNFDVKNESHELKLDSFNVNNKTATITISSEPQTKTLSVGEEWKVNLNNNTYYDLLVRLDNVTSTRANVFIQEINEEIDVIDEGDSGTQKEAIKDKDCFGGINCWYYIGAGIVLALVLLVVAFFIGKKYLKKKK